MVPNALQNTVLEHLRDQKVPVMIYLVNGVRLQGVVTEIDGYCLLLTRGGASQLVYKSAILSIMPDQTES
jgi:host factor-I protein